MPCFSTVNFLKPEFSNTSVVASFSFQVNMFIQVLHIYRALRIDSVTDEYKVAPASAIVAKIPPRRHKTSFRHLNSVLFASWKHGIVNTSIRRLKTRTILTSQWRIYSVFYLPSKVGVVYASKKRHFTYF